MNNAVECALFYGPWLMGVDSYWNPMFHGEPYDANELFLSESTRISFERNPGLPLLHGPRIQMIYRHGGFTDLCHVTLHPVCDQTAHLQSTVSFWHRFKREQP